VPTHLQNKELILNQDFSFTADGKLKVSKPTKVALVAALAADDRLLVEAVLFNTRQSIA
jgi:hypothetical protein